MPFGAGRKRRRSGAALYPYKYKKKPSGKKVAVPSTLSMNTAIIATTQKATFRYAFRFQLNPGAGGTPAIHVFSANGAYDPDITSVGHQPRGFDQLMSLYDHFVVKSTKIKLFADNNTEIAAQVVGVQLRDAASGDIDYESLQEYGYKSDMLLASHTSGPSARTLTWKVNPLEFLGKHPIHDPEIKGSASGNPIEQAYLWVYSYPIHDGDAQPINVMAELEMEVDLIEPKQPTGS